MGKLKSKLLNEDIKLKFAFLKDFLTHEKIEVFNLLNDDYLLDEETFCNFFLCNTNNFLTFDKDEIGIIGFLDVQMTLILLREDNPLSKVSCNLIILFNVIIFKYLKIY